MRKITNRFVLSTLCLAGFDAGCWTAAQEARVAALEQHQAETQQTAIAASHGVAMLNNDLDNAARDAARQQHCKEPEIIEFMDSVQEGIGNACSPISLAKSLNFLAKIPVATMHLYPDKGMQSLLRTRIGQIRQILARDKLYPSTRILVMVKPAEDTEAGRTFAKGLAQQVIEDYVKPELPQGPVVATAGSVRGTKPPDRLLPGPEKIMGPYLLPCTVAEDMSKDLSRLYNKPYFRPIHGEPKNGKPAVVIFVVVSPC